MIQKTTLTLLLLGIPLGAAALGLGEIELRSGLNQALNAEIELLSVSAEQLESLSVGLASRQAFADVGIERGALLSQLRFKVEQRADGAPYINVFTQEPIREPYLQYLVEVNSPSGRLVREYTLLLDPPTLASQDAIQAPVVNARRASAAESSSVSAPAGDFTAGSTYGPIQPGETLGQIAQRLKGSGSANVNQIMLALLEANPEAFKNNNINTLKVGVTLRIPEENAVTRLSKEEARRLVREQSALWKNARTRTTNPALVSSPSPDATAVPALTQEAILNELAKSSQAQAQSSPLSQTRIIPTESIDARLKLLGSADLPNLEGAALEDQIEAGSAGDEAQNAEIEQLRKDLSLTAEAVEAKRQENEELRSRLVELEEQTSAIKRLLTLKESDIASLQSRFDQAQGNPSLDLVPSATPDETINAGLPPAGVAENVTENAVASELPDAAEVADLTPPVTETEQVAALNPAAPSELVLPKPEPVAEAAKQPVAQPSILDSIIDQIRSNWIIQILIALALLTVLTAFWFVRRRRNNAEYIAMDMFADAPIAGDVTIPPLRLDTDEFSSSVDEVVSGIEPALKLAIAKNPSRHDLRLQLLKIYYQAGNLSAFTAAAQQFRAGMKDRQSVMWDEIAAMGRELSPANALFAASGGQAEFNPAPVAAAGGYDVAVRASDVPEFVYRQEREEGIAVADTLSFKGRVSPAESVSLSLINGGIVNDKIGTKLDLARAYIEMGDPDGAQSILDEVTREGSDLYQHQVEELQRRIG